MRKSSHQSKVTMLLDYLIENIKEMIKGNDGNDGNPSVTNESCWSLDIRYCGIQLYLDKNNVVGHMECTCARIWDVREFGMKDDFFC